MLVATTYNTKISLSKEDFLHAVEEMKVIFKDEERWNSVNVEEIASKAQDHFKSLQLQEPVNLETANFDTHPVLKAERPVATPVDLVGISPCALSIGVVVFDAIVVVLGFVGLHFPGGAATEAAVEGVAQVVARNMPLWRNLINELTAAEGLWNQAKAIFNIASAGYTAGMFGPIMKAIQDSMSWWDWTIAGVAALAQIAALFLTDGLAFIAQLALNGAAIAQLISDAVKVADKCGS